MSQVSRSRPQSEATDRNKIYEPIEPQMCSVKEDEREYQGSQLSCIRSPDYATDEEVVLPASQ